MNLIQKLLVLNETHKRMPQHEARELYNNGYITWKELQNLIVEYSTDILGKKFYYVCPKCLVPMRHCPDPVCAKEGVGHHLLEEDWQNCDEDIKYKDALVYYDGYFIDNKDEEKLKQELKEVFDKFGIEFQGEFQGTIQLKDEPNSKIGCYIKF